MPTGDTLMTSAAYISTVCTATQVLCRGSGSGGSNTHTKLFTSRREVWLWQVTGTIMGSWRAVHQAATWLGRCPGAHQYSATVWWHDIRVHGWGGGPERQEGASAAVLANIALSLHLSHTITALREGLWCVSCSGRPQPGYGSSTGQPFTRHPGLENVTILQCSTAFSRNSTHVATMWEVAALLSYLISKSCYVPDAEVNPLLSPWTCGSQKGAVAHLCISINIHHLQGNLA